MGREGADCGSRSRRRTEKKGVNEQKDDMLGKGKYMGIASIRTHQEQEGTRGGA